MDIEERLGQLIDEQHGVTVMLSQKTRNRYIQRRDALRNEIAADFRAREELVAKLVEALDGIKSLLGPEGEYAICKADGTKLWLGDDMIVGGAFEKADTALARVKGE